MISGIYKITNTTNNKVYVGSTKDYLSRKRCHLCQLRKGKHHSKYLQRSYNKYGEENFKFELIIPCPVRYLVKMEQWFFNELKPEYNILPIAGTNLGKIVTQETRIKISNTLRGRKATFPKTEQQIIDLINRSRKEVIQFDLDMNFIKTWESQSKVARDLKLSQSMVSKSCREPDLIVGNGFKFRYNYGYN